MLYINGEWRDAASGATFESTDPATGAVIGSVADGGVADMQSAVEAARRGVRRVVHARTAYERSEYLYQAHRLMLERAEELAQLMTDEQGKPLRMARNEVGYAADFLLWFAEEAKRVYGDDDPLGARRPAVPRAAPAGRGGRRRSRRGTTRSRCSPGRSAPALAAGCTIVLKPAEQTPLCAVEVFKIFDDVGLPAGVVNLVTDRPARDRRRGAADAPARCASSPSPAPPRSASCSRRRRAAGVKRVSLELGGHAPFIVFADADPVHAPRRARPR